MKTILALLLLSTVALADTPAPGSVKIKGATGNTVTSTNVGGKEGIDTNIIGPISATVSSSLGSPLYTQLVYSGVVIDPRVIRNLSQVTDSVLAFQGSPPWAITASSLPLPSGAATNSALTTINTTLGSPFQAGGSIGNTAFGISGLLPAFASPPTFNLGTLNGAATAAKQDTGNTSVASIDTKTVHVDTGAVTVISTVLPPNAATATNQAAANASLASIDGKIPASPSQEHTTAGSPNAARLTDGTTFYKATTPADTQPVSVASMPLPAGAATAAKQDTGNTSLASILAQLDVALSTRASEATLASVKAKTDNIDVFLSTRATESTLATRASESTLSTRASESTLGLVKAKTDNLDTLLSTRAADATLVSTNTKLDTLHTDFGVVEGKQDTGNTSLSSIDTKLTSQATAANQATMNTRLGDVTETAPATDTASSGLNGRLQRIAQRLTTAIASLSSILTGQTDGTQKTQITVLPHSGDVAATGSLTSACATTVNPTGCAASSYLELNTQGTGAVRFEITGTWVGTISFEGLAGSGAAAWYPLSATSITPPGTSLSTSTTVNDIFLIAVPGGYSKLRVKMNPYTSGTAVVAMNGSAVTNTVVAFQTTPNNMRTQIYGSDTTNAPTTTQNAGTGKYGLSASIANVDSLNVTGSGSALNNTPIADTDVSMYHCASIQHTVTGTNTVTFEQSNDDVTFFSNVCVSATAANTAPVTTAAATGMFYCPINSSRFRTRISAFTSGTSTDNARFSPLSCDHLQELNVAAIQSGTWTVNTNPAIPTFSTQVASSARTTSGNSGNITQAAPNSNGAFEVNVTAVSGTLPTLDVVFQESYDNGTTWTDEWHLERITANGQFTTPNLLISTSHFRFVWTIGGTTPSFTFSIGSTQGSSQGQWVRRFFDRTIDPNTASSTSAAFNVEGCKSFNFTANVASCVAVFPTFAIQLSEDGTNYWNTSNTDVFTANGTVGNTTFSSGGKFARVITQTGGASCVLGYLTIRCSQY